MKVSVKKKQKKLIKNVASRKFKTVRAAAIDAGYSPQATDSTIARAVESAHRTYLNALEEAGATDKKSARVISEAMDAERSVSVEDFTEDAKSPRGGQAYTTVTEPDHPTRLKANEQFLKVKKIMGSDESEGGQKNQLIIVMGHDGKKAILGEEII